MIIGGIKYTLKFNNDVGQMLRWLRNRNLILSSKDIK